MILYVFLCVVFYFIYTRFIKPGFYWQNKGIYHVKPWARFVKFFLTEKSFFQGVLEAYREFPDKRYYGSYQFLRPSLLVKDLDLIKKITVKDFEYFPDHFSITNEKSDPIMALNLFTLKGEKWKDMRTTLSPAFTSSKMRSMFTLMAETAENFTNFFQKNNDNIIELEMKDVYSKFTTDVIASCAFGIKCDSLEDTENEFFQMGKEITSFRVLAALRAFINVLFPKLFELLKLSVFSTRIVNFFRKIVKDTISYREEKSIVRPDMIHLLMEARKGRLKHEEKDQETAGFATVEESSIGKSHHSKLELTDDVITAQALIFFFAGFDTASTMLSFMSYELALNPDIQEKLQEEIDETLNNYAGQIQYEEVLNMKYLDQVVSETLRKYPPGYILTRMCVKDYKIPAKFPDEKDLVLDKGCLIGIPVNGVHLDPQYFPNPDKFDPDRFSEENKSSIIPGSYMPFGSGPRNCIGSRFALLESKALIVCLLSKFHIVPVEKTEIPLQFTKTINLNAKNGVHLGLKKRK